MSSVLMFVGKVIRDSKLDTYKKLFKPRNLYLTIISLIGVALVLRGLFQLPTVDPLLFFFLLVVLAIAAQMTSTSLLSGNVTVEVSTAVSLATVSLFGPAAATIVAAAAITTLSAISLYKVWLGWSRAVERISFNVGMGAISIYLAGLVFQVTQNWLGNDTILGYIVPWLLAAVINDQINLWILIGMLHLDNGINPWEIWQDHKWAIPINVLVMSVGGGILAVAVQQFNFLGIAIFFLPIALSAYSFRLYVNQAKRQMEKLEDLVNLRTGALADANEKLEELNKEKDAFLAVLTHDMRTPLTSIKGYGSILQDRELSREQQIKIAKVILHSQETLLDIVNNILELEKLQSGVPVLLETSHFDLALVAKMAAESIVAQANEKKITLEYDPVPSPVMITADMNKIQRVLLNLISNAIKYTPEEGNVCIKTFANGRHAIFEVQDTGYGIPEDELPYIFDRYSRVKGHQHLAIGTGLGLAIVKSLIDAHKGEISVASEENVGSTFTVKLPMN